MTRYLLLGMVGAGKSTLFKALCDTTEEVGKTQAAVYDVSGGVDTPGEFFCFPQYYPALLSLTSDADVLVYVHAADDPECHLPPGFLDVYRDRKVIAAITKGDLPGADIAATEKMLRDNGLAGPFFVVSRGDAEGVRTLKAWLHANA